MLPWIKRISKLYQSGNLCISSLFTKEEIREGYRIITTDKSISYVNGVSESIFKVRYVPANTLFNASWKRLKVNLTPNDNVNENGNGGNEVTNNFYTDL